MKWASNYLNWTHTLLSSVEASTLPPRELSVRPGERD